MTDLVVFVITNYKIPNEEFLRAFLFRSNINTFDEFCELLAWWACRNDPEMNIYKNSWFGVVQQYRNLLSEDDSWYIDFRSAYWFDGIVPLREVLDNVKFHFS